MVGVLSRETMAKSLPISAGFGKVLQILVENQGRINFGIANDFKGIIGNAFLNDAVLDNWNITGFPFDDAKQFVDLFAFLGRESDQNVTHTRHSEHLHSGPMIFHGTFDIDHDEIADMYINPMKWGKVKYLLLHRSYAARITTTEHFFFFQGFIIVNGFNLGRYWPLVGPQITLYLPKELLHKQQNSIIVVELQRAPRNGHMKFSDKPIYTKEN